MNSRGFLLLEMLTAIILVSLAGAGLAAGFVQILKGHQRIETSFRNYDEFRILSLRLEKDARNAVSLAGYPFRGKEEEIFFPVLESEAGIPKLILVGYFVKGHSLIRSTRELTPKLEKPQAFERVVAGNISTLEFQFPYLGKENEIAYEPFWPEEPSYGIPRALRLNFAQGEARPGFSKLISIPQGKWGHLSKN